MGNKGPRANMVIPPPSSLSPFSALKGLSAGTAYGPNINLFLSAPTPPHCGTSLSPSLFRGKLVRAPSRDQIPHARLPPTGYPVQL